MQHSQLLFLPAGISNTTMCYVVILVTSMRPHCCHWHYTLLLCHFSFFSVTWQQHCWLGFVICLCRCITDSTTYVIRKR